MTIEKSLLFPDRKNVSHIDQVNYSSGLGKNMAIYSFRQNKTIYLSHFYKLDLKQNGKGFVYTEDGKPLAEFPLVDGKPHGKGKADNGYGLEEQYFYYGEIFPIFFNSTIVSANGDKDVVELYADLAVFNKRELEKKKFPNWILTFGKKSSQKLPCLQKQREI